MAGVALVAIGSPPAAAVANRRVRQGPVLSFFADRPLLDPTGRLPAYVPPGGARGGEPVEGLSEREWRCLRPF
jgi:hypothetical protein